MASNDVIADLAKRPMPQKLGILFGILAAFGLLYYQFFYSDLQDDFRAGKIKNDTLVKQNKELKDRLTAFKELVRQNDELKEILRKNLVSLPSSAELPSFFVHLQKQAASSGVNIRNWSRQKEVPVETYFKVPVGMEITGSFYQINHYFKLLNQTDRIISIENLTLGGASTRNDETLLTAKFTASTFRLKDAPEDVPVVPADDKKKKGSKVEKAKKQREASVEKATGEKTTDKDEAETKAPDDNAKAGADRVKNPGAGAP